MNQIQRFFSKIFSQEILSYLIFGVLTTLLNIILSYVLTAFCGIEGNVASTIGILVSIVFAYVTNRKWVFRSQAETTKEISIEFGKFLLGRSFTMLFEIFGVFFLNNILHAFYGMTSDNFAYLINKILITILVIMLNFFISKFFAFKR